MMKDRDQKLRNTADTSQFPGHQAD